MSIWSYLPNLITAITSVIAVVIAASEVHKIKVVEETAWIRQKKQNTLEAYNCLQTEVFDELNKYKPKEIKQICEYTQDSEYKKISGYLARIERFCVGINQDIYDINTFYQVAHGYFDEGTMHNRLIPILEVKGIDASEDYFSNIHEVWRKMGEISGKSRE